MRKALINRSHSRARGRTELLRVAYCEVSMPLLFSDSTCVRDFEVSGSLRSRCLFHAVANGISALVVAMEVQMSRSRNGVSGKFGQPGRRTCRQPDFASSSANG